MLAVQVLNYTSSDSSPVRTWLERDDPGLRTTLNMLTEILTQKIDYPTASVALRRMAQLALASRA